MKVFVGSPANDTPSCLCFLAQPQIWFLSVIISRCLCLSGAAFLFCACESLSDWGAGCTQGGLGAQMEGPKNSGTFSYMVRSDILVLESSTQQKNKIPTWH